MRFLKLRVGVVEYDGSSRFLDRVFATRAKFTCTAIALALVGGSLQAQTLHLSALTNELQVHDETLVDLFELAPEIAFGPNGTYRWGRIPCRPLESR